MIGLSASVQFLADNIQGFTGRDGGIVAKNPPGSAGDERDISSILGLGRRLGEGKGNPLQCSCLEYPVDGGAWGATVHGVTESRTRLSARTRCMRALTLDVICRERNTGEDLEVVRHGENPVD